MGKNADRGRDSPTISCSIPLSLTNNNPMCASVYAMKLLTGSQIILCH